MANDTLAETRATTFSLSPTGAGAVLAQRAPRQSAQVQLAAAVEERLRDFIDAQIDALQTVDPALGGFARTARDHVLAGGKRLRPTFAYWGWRGLAGSEPSTDPVLPALAALELMHTFALVHDDVMDASATRRGRPTAHRVFAAQHTAAARRGDGDRFGEAAAVLVGDLCLIWADQLLAGASLPARSVLAARRCYDQMRVEAVAGQYLDILGDAEPHGWSVERAMRVARYKTASYTVLRPLHFGAALAAGHGVDDTDPVTRALIGTAYTRYGHAVGEAFQLRDDLLGVYGDPAVTGKPAGDDLRTGKPTTLLMLARELSSPAQRAELDRGPAGAVNPADGSGGPLTDAAGPATRAGPADVSRLADIVAATGAVARVEAMIAERVADALDAVAGAPIDEPARRALADLAMTATHRRA